MSFMKTHHTVLIALCSSALLLTGCTSMRESTGSAQETSFNQLPTAAQDTVRREIGDRPIARVTEETKYGQPAYRVEVKTQGVNPALWVTADGSILKESRSLASSHSREIKEPAGAQSPRSTEEPKQNDIYNDGPGVHSGQDF